MDLNKGRSVTNDAIAVIFHLQNTLPGGIGSRRVYYQDTTGRFDQLLVDKDSRFKDYAPCSESQQTNLKNLIKDDRDD